MIKGVSKVNNEEIFEIIKIPYWLTKNGGLAIKTEEGDIAVEKWDVITSNKTHVKINGKKYRLMKEEKQ
jgi:hypothetical protein